MKGAKVENGAYSHTGGWEEGRLNWTEKGGPASKMYVCAELLVLQRKNEQFV